MPTLSQASPAPAVIAVTRAMKAWRKHVGGANLCAQCLSRRTMQFVDRAEDNGLYFQVSAWPARRQRSHELDAAQIKAFARQFDPQLLQWSPRS